MKKQLLACLVLAALLAGCKKEDLPPADAVLVKFINKTGSDVKALVVNRLEIGDLAKGKSTSGYHRYEAFGEQFGYTLVEAVATVKGKRHFASSACQGVCGTESAPEGRWLEPGYYKVSIHLAPPGEYLDFRLE